MNQFEKFAQLHNNSEPLLIGNCWDVGSARIFEGNGFAAIATSSAAVANSLGYEDGESLPFDLLLEVVKRIRKNTSLPFSVDMERGYSNSINGIIQNIEKLFDIGIAGINIEDTFIENEKQLQDSTQFSKTLSSIADHLAKKNMRVFINARTDAFLLGMQNPLPETLKRIKEYENAGASGIFVPFIKNENDITEVVRATSLPVNVLTVPQLPGIKKLSALGVRRISLGSSMYRVVTKQMINKIETIKTQQSFDSLF